MKIKDHFLSQELFEVKSSSYKGILQTEPKPKASDLHKYYETSNYISHQTKASSLKDKVYQFVKSLMIKRKMKWVFNYKSAGSILDIGSGTGDFLQAFNALHWKKNAIEPSIKLHPVLKSKNIELFNSIDLVEENSQDVISMWHSLEHIPNLEYTLRHLKRILKPDGVLFVAVPNYKAYDAKYYKSFWAAWDVPRHLWHFSREGLKSLMQNYGFSCVEEKPLIFDAFYVSLLSEQYHPQGKIIRSFWKGMQSNVKAGRDREYSSILYVFNHKQPKR